MKNRIDVSKYIGLGLTNIPKELVKLKYGLEVFEGDLVFNKESGVILLYTHENYKLMNSDFNEYLDKDELSTIEFELNNYTL